MSVLIIWGYVVALKTEVGEDHMLSIAPASVLLMAVIGLLVISFATTRMAFLERRTRHHSLARAAAPGMVRSTA